MILKKLFFLILNNLIVTAMHHQFRLIKLRFAFVEAWNGNSTDRSVIIANDFSVTATRLRGFPGMVAHAYSFYSFCFLFWRYS